MNLIIIHCFYRLVTSTLSGPNIFLSTVFSSTLSLTFLRYDDKVSHPHKKNRKYCSFVLFIYSYTANGKAKYSGTTSTRHSLNCLCSQFLYASYFDLLVSYPIIWTLPHFKALISNLYVVICSAAGSRYKNVSLAFSAFVSRPNSLLATNTASVFFFITGVHCFSPTYYYRHRPQVDVFHLISIPLSLPGLSYSY
jgi:hypothetical protein